MVEGSIASALAFLAFFSVLVVLSVVVGAVCARPAADRAASDTARINNLSFTIFKCALLATMDLS
jgi:hypothetical protein